VFSTSSYGGLDDGDASPLKRGRSRKVEPKPVYVLDITLPSQVIDNCVEPAKTAVHLMVRLSRQRSFNVAYTLQIQNDDAISSFLKAVVHSFLVRHGFIVHDTQVSPCPTPSPLKRRRIDGHSSTKEQSFAPEAEDGLNSHHLSERSTFMSANTDRAPLIIVPVRQPSCFVHITA
jgi:DNA mismatch repair protein MLH3